MLKHWKVVFSIARLKTDRVQSTKKVKAKSKEEAKKKFKKVFPNVRIDKVKWYA